MTTSIPVPSLSSLGWVTDPGNKADLLLSHFFEAEKSQTFIYGDNVSSMQFLLQQYGHNINSLIANTQSVLEKYLGRYYDLATVSVTCEEADVDTSGDVNITIRCKVNENGTTFDIATAINVVNSKIVKIINLNNNG
jgi:hypothetical protein